MSVGNKREATKAIAGLLKRIDNSERTGVGAFAGYRGYGTTRVVFVNASRTVVYKLGLAPGYDYYNRTEHERASSLRAQTGLNYIPPTSLYKVSGRLVLAMPFYPHPIDAFGPKRMAEIMNGLAVYLEDLGLIDLPAFNFRLTAGGQARVIDLGA